MYEINMSVNMLMRVFKSCPKSKRKPWPALQYVFVCTHTFIYAILCAHIHNACMSAGTPKLLRYRILACVR